MATDHPNKFRLSVPEIYSLIDRLRARSVSHLLMKSDLGLAAAALKTFVSKMPPEQWIELNGNDAHGVTRCNC
jgi:hypothetical protein